MKLNDALGTLNSPKTLSESQRLVFGSEAADQVLAIRKGMVVLAIDLDSGRRQVLRFCSEGEMVIPTYLAALREFEIRAVTDAELVWIDPSALKPSCPEHARILALLNEHWVNDCQLWVNCAAIFGRLSATERLATFLLQLLARNGQRSAPDILLELPMNRTDIADYLSINPDTVSRLMHRFQKDGSLRSSSRGVYLANLDKLADKSPVASLVLAQEGVISRPNLGRFPLSTSQTPTTEKAASTLFSNKPSNV